MNPNPTGEPMGTPAPSSAREAVNVPSILILALAGLGALFALLGLISAASGGDNAMAQMLMKFMPPEQRDQMANALAQQAQGGRGRGIIQSVIGLAFSGLTIFGALQMRNLKSFGLAMTAAILVMLPCASSACCCIGIPIGIWALVVLNKPEVKSAFS